MDRISDSGVPRNPPAHVSASQEPSHCGVLPFAPVLADSAPIRFRESPIFEN